MWGVRGEEWGIQGIGGEMWGKGIICVSRRRWEDNIKMDLQEMGIGFMDWIDLAQNMNRFLALANAVMKFRVT